MDSSLEFLHQQSLLCTEWIPFKDDLTEITKHISLVNKRLLASTDTAHLIRRLQFLCYELRSQLAGNESVENKFEILNDFFFKQKNFLVQLNIESEIDDLNCQSLFLENTLVQRSGCPMLISLIYSHLALHIGLPLYFIDLEPKYFLKYEGLAKTLFVDLSRNGSFLTAEELLESIRCRLKDENISISQICESLTFREFLVSYLSHFKKKFIMQSKLNELLIIQNSLLDLLPQNLNLLGERAILYYKLNLPKNSVLDLKRYFSFQHRDRAPQELIRIYDELIGHS